jgi:hypothetical protein
MAYLVVVVTLGGTAPARPVFHGLAAGWVFLLGFHAYWSLRYNANAAKGLFASNAQLSLRLVELVSTNVALTLLFAEASLRALAAWSGTSLVVNAAVDGYRLTPGQDYGAGLHGNELGYPGPDFQRNKRPGVYRIAALGDSFAIGPAVPFADNFLTLLETSLPGVEVYNFGVAGAGPREYYAILERDVWAFQPDLVLLCIFVGNDITESLVTPRHLDLRQHALYLAFQRGWRLLRERGLYAVSQPGLAERCATPPLSPRAYWEIEARRLSVCVQPTSAAMEKKWQRALRYLQEIVFAGSRQRIPLAVVLIPDEFQVNPLVRAEALATAGTDPAVLDLRLPQERLGAFFQDRGVPCLDLLPAFADVRDAYAPCDTHWNVRGNRLAAEQIREWLLRDTLHGRLRLSVGSR